MNAIDTAAYLLHSRPVHEETDQRIMRIRRFIERHYSMTPDGALEVIREVQREYRGRPYNGPVDFSHRPMWP